MQLAGGPLAPPEVHLQGIDNGDGPPCYPLLHWAILRVPPGIGLQVCNPSRLILMHSWIISPFKPPQLISPISVEVVSIVRLP